MSRKIYTSPIVKSTSFALSTDVASGCQATASFAEFTCAVEVPEWGLTFYTELNCDYSPPGDDDMICYHVPTADSNIFDS